MRIYPPSVGWLKKFLGFGVWGLGFGVWGLTFFIGWLLGFGFLGFGIWGLDFWGLEFDIFHWFGVRLFKFPHTL